MKNTKFEKFDILIIGAGVIGLSIAYFLSFKKKKILLVEKNKKIGKENSSLNSAVVHAGIYYKKNSMKSKFTIEGRKLLQNFCKKNKIKYKVVGKLFICNKKDKYLLDKILKQGKKNNIKNLKIINKNQINKLEPNLIADYALYSKSSAIFDVDKFVDVIKKKILKKKTKIKNGLFFVKKHKNNQNYIFKNSRGKNYIFKSDYLINCSGINAIKVARKLNNKILLPKSNLVTGAYLVYSQKIFTQIIYSIFKPGKITERTDATPDLNGNTIFGPSVEINDKINWNNLRNRFYESIKSYYPRIDKRKLKKFKYGIRPKIYYKSKSEVNDFYIKKEKNIINLLGIESPGLTSCLAIGKHVSELVK
ncbi:FAD-dependent oxidoreductase [Candidatus Pelagibacter sp.]|nr:FAD-dependent oxidoreductase [Candidatus Pelagibacter sp.]